MHEPIYRPGRRGNLLLSALAVFAVHCAPAAPGGDGGRLPPEGHRLVHHFPGEAVRILYPGAGFFAAEDGLRPEPTPRSGPLGIRLPYDGADPFRLELPDGFSVDVTEDGLHGPAQVAGDAVVYARDGGLSFWTRSGEGFEEWLLLHAPPPPGRPAARWIVEGGTLRQVGPAVLVTDAEGLPRLRVTAPAAFGPGGAPVPVRLSVEDGALSVHVSAAEGPVLIDPLWQAAGTMTYTRVGHTLTLLADGRVLAAGGEGRRAGEATDDFLTSAEVYDPTTDAWDVTGDMTRFRSDHAAVLLDDDRVLVTGGRNGSEARMRWTEVFHPDAAEWSGVQNMGHGRRSFTLTRLPDGRVLAVGGTSTGATEIYSPGDDAWTSLSQTLDPPPEGHTATLHGPLGGQQVLVAGGRESGGSALLERVWLFDPDLEEWRQAPPMPDRRNEHAAVRLLDGSVLIVGGRSTSAGATDTVWHFAEGEWTTLSRLSQARRRHTLTLRPDGSVVAAGGVGADGSRLNHAEVYRGGDWAASTTLGARRQDHRAVLLENGEVLVVGGFGSAGILDSAERLAAPPTELAFDSDAITVTAGECTPVDVALQHGGELTRADRMLVVTLTSTVADVLHGEADCTEVASTFEYGLGDDVKTLYVRSTTTATFEVVADHPELTRAEATVTVASGPPDDLRFVTQPSSKTAGELFSPEVSVEWIDAFGNRATTTEAITLALHDSGGSSVPFEGQATRSAVDGLATFTGVQVTQAGTGYQFAPSGPSTVGPDSDAFSVSPGAPDRLVFETVPDESQTAGELLSPAPRVQVLDEFDNLTDAAISILLDFYESPDGATFDGALTVTSAGGVAEFSDVRAFTAGQYTFRATSGTLSSSPRTFELEPADPIEVIYLSDGQNVTVGECSDPIRLGMRDAHGNAASPRDPETMSLSGDPETTLFADPECQNEISSIVWPAGEPEWIFYASHAAIGEFQTHVTWPDTTVVTQTHEAVASDVATRLRFVPAVVATVAGDCSEAIVLRSENSTGQATEPAEALQVFLSAPASTRIHLGPDCEGEPHAPAEPIVIGPGAAEIAISVAGDVAGTFAVEATGAPLSPGTLTQTVNPGPAESLAFASDPQEVLSGACSAAVYVEALDAHGNAVIGVPLPDLALSADDPDFAFHPVSGCGDEPVETVPFGSDAGRWGFRFLGTTAGEITVTVTVDGLGSDAQIQTVVAGPPARLDLSGPATVTVDACAGPYRVTLGDAHGNEATAAAGRQVDLGAADVVFYEDADCGTETSLVWIDTGESHEAFHLRATAAGGHALEATSTGLDPGSLTVTASDTGEPGTFDVTVDPLEPVKACTNALVSLQLLDGDGAPYRIPLAVTLAVDSPDGDARIEDTSLGGVPGGELPATQVTGLLAADGSATVRVALDDAGTVNLTWSATEFPGWGESDGTAITFGRDIGATLTANPTEIVAGDAGTGLELVLRDACAWPESATSVAFLVAGATTSDAVEVEPGRYAAQLTVASAADCSPRDVTVQAQVDGVLVDTTTVGVGCPDLSPGDVHLSLSTPASRAAVGDRIRVVARIENDGSGQVTAGRLQATLVGLDWLGPDGEPGEDGVVLDAPTVAGGAAADLPLEVRANRAGEARITATFTFDAGGAPETLEEVFTLEIRPRSPYGWYGCAGGPGGGGAAGLVLLLAALGLFRAGSRIRRGAAAAAVALGLTLALPHAARAEAPAERPGLAFMGITATAGVEPDVAAAVSEFLQTALARTGAYRVIGSGDIETLLGLEQQRQLLGCDDDSACMAELAGALGVERALSGNLSLLGESVILNLRLLDAEGARVVARIGERVRARNSLDALLDAIPGIVDQVVAADPLARPFATGSPPPPPRAPAGPVALTVGLRADADLLTPGGPRPVPGLAVGVDRGAIGGGASLLWIPGTGPREAGARPVALRLEGRWRPVDLAPVSVHVLAGLVSFLPETGLRLGAGAALPVGPVTMTGDLAFERLLAFEPDLMAPNMLVFSLGVALRL